MLERARGILIVATLAACGVDSASQGSETDDSGGEPDGCVIPYFGIWFDGPIGDASMVAPFVATLSYVSPGRATDCPCGTDCGAMPVDEYEFDMLGLASLPACFTVEYGWWATEGQGAWIVFRDATAGNEGTLLLAAGVDPWSMPPSLSGFSVEESGSTPCDDSELLDLSFRWGEKSVELESGDSALLETPEGTMTVSNEGATQPFEGLQRNSWRMVPIGAVLDD